MDDLFTKDDYARTIERLRHGRPKARCARAAGISRTAWGLYESGKRKPKEKTLSKVVIGLGVTPSKFVDELGKSVKQRLRAEDEGKAQSAPPSPAEDPFWPALKERLQAIVREFKELSVLLDSNPKDLRP